MSKEKAGRLRRPGAAARRRFPAAVSLVLVMCLAVTLGVAMAWGAAGCSKGAGGGPAGGAPAAKGPGPTLAGAPWGSGDRCVYDVMVQGAAVGSCVFTAAPGQKGGKRAAVFTNEITVGEAKETTTAWGDAGTLMALASDVKGSIPQGGEYTVTATYGPKEIKIEANVPGQGPQTVTRALPDYCWDNEQFLGSIRALPLAAGYSQTLTVISTKVSVKADCALTVEGEEKVTVPAGSYDCYKVCLDFQGTKQYAWYSKDEKRILVKYDNAAAGSTFVLKETGLEKK